MNYAKKLRDPRWQKKRLEILSRDHFTCNICADTETELHIHHKQYYDNYEPWEYDDEDLVTLCKHCHALTEELKKTDRVPVIVVKTKYNDLTATFFISCIYRMHSMKGAGFFYYVDNTLIEKDNIKPATYQSVKTLIALSEKL